MDKCTWKEQTISSKCSRSASRNPAQSLRQIGNSRALSFHRSGIVLGLTSPVEEPPPKAERISTAVSDECVPPTFCPIYIYMRYKPLNHAKTFMDKICFLRLKPLYHHWIARKKKKKNISPSLNPCRALGPEPNLYLLRVLDS